MSCATETTLTVFVMYLPPLTWEIYLLVNLRSYMLPLFFRGRDKEEDQKICQAQER